MHPSVEAVGSAVMENVPKKTAELLFIVVERFLTICMAVDANHVGPLPLSRNSVTQARIRIKFRRKTATGVKRIKNTAASINCVTWQKTLSMPGKLLCGLRIGRKPILSVPVITLVRVSRGAALGSRKRLLFPLLLSKLSRGSSTTAIGATWVLKGVRATLMRWIM
jgi:hypothetical protein